MTGVAMEATQLAATSHGVWFSTSLQLNDSGHIGYVGNSLELRLFTLNNHDSGGVAMKSDGSVWFTERGSPENGQDFVTYLRPPSATVHRIRIPTLATLPGNVAVSQEGSIFFCEEAANAIGEVVGNKVVERRLPKTEYSRVDGPHAIAVWKRNVYVIDGRENVLLMQVDGRWSQVLTSTSDFSALSVSSHGVWFSDPKAEDIGLISERGGRRVVDRIPVPWNAVPVGIAAGTSGVYFTTGLPFLGRFVRGKGFSKVFLRNYDPRYGYPSVLAIAGSRLWYSYRVAHTDTSKGVIGFVPI